MSETLESYLVKTNNLRDKLMSNKHSDSEMILMEMRKVHGTALKEQALNNAKKDSFLNLSLNDNILHVIHEIVRECDKMVFKERVRKMKEKTVIDDNVTSSDVPSELTNGVSETSVESRLKTKIIKKATGTEEIHLNIPLTEQ